MILARLLVPTLLALLAMGLPARVASAQAPATQKADADWVKRKGDVDWVVSMILPEPKPVDSARLAAALRRRVTEKEQFTGYEEGKDLVLLRIAGGTALVSLMQAPIPGGELQDVCRHVWRWPQACETVKDHKAHMLAVLMGTRLSKAQSALLHTKIVAAVLEATDAVAAYWGTSLNSRKIFLDESAQVASGLTPTTLWVSYRASRDAAGRFSLSTHGLKDFGLMEIEVKDADRPFIELYGLVEGMAAYLITKGPIIRDGDTIGHSNAQRIRVWHGASYWRPGLRAYRLGFDR